MNEAINNLLECKRVCLETITHCLEMGGEHASADHISHLMDCAKMCETASSFLILDSEFSGDVCELCADIAEACAESCEELDGTEMERCAEACRRAAASCRKFTETE